jgi:hypothetical protein
LDEKLWLAVAAREAEVEAGYKLLAQDDDFWGGIDQSIVEAQEKRERDRTSRPPRVWESIKDIPEGVVARDNEAGWFWKVSGPESSSSTNGKHWSGFSVLRPSEDKYGPFTEVLDTERAEASSSSGPASPDRAEQKGSK